MSLHHDLKVGVTLTLAASLLAAAGCASVRPKTTAAVAQDAPAATAAAAAPAVAVPAADPATSTGDEAPAAAPRPITRAVVSPTAPLHYTVKRGDTLWGISTMFLKDPWLWPEIWYDNPQIHNPHLIFPGDVLVLGYGANGRPRIYVEHGGAIRAKAESQAANALGDVRLEPRLRSSLLKGAIPAIPYASIAAFLSRPAIVARSEFEGAPHVVAFENRHQIAGAGDYAYVRGLRAPLGARFVVLHIGEKLRDPQSGRVLGYQGLYTATAVVVNTRQPEKVLLTNSERETLRGDCLFRNSAGAPLNFEPKPPSAPVDGRIVSVIDDVNAIGQYDIVAINRGTSHGVTPGTVLAVDRAGDTVIDRGPASYSVWNRGGALFHRVKLPSERAGTLLVFKSYEDMSYALVVGASEPMRVDDIVRNP